MIKYGRMEVYIEYVVIDNFIIDYLLLKLALKYSKVEFNKKRAALSALIGTAVAVAMPIFKASSFIKVLIKVGLAFLMIRVCFKPQSVKKYFSALGLFLTFTVIFGGAAALVMQLFCIDYDFFYGSSAFPLGASLLFFAALYKIFKRAFTRVFEKTLIYPFTRTCVLICDGERIKAKGLIDSGNNLIFKGSFAVCVPSGDLTEKMRERGFFSKGSLGEIVIKTAAGASLLEVFEIDELLIYCGDKANIIKRPKIGIGGSESNFGDEYEIILSAEYAAF